ncbi:unnamed protein product [Sphenostylis stenocarpa]|uniref:Fatty acid hydroxylase domain-containing protein n=1 Tax=Sphenostylis stenocarpa TaxID=92480 RepID=A0AA86W1V3_9FABA|nr:unnamed protein product [Sphenostylis stenocarpa]
MVFWEGYYRLHTRKDEEKKNLVPFSTVVKGVLLQQLVQAIVTLFLPGLYILEEVQVKELKYRIEAIILLELGYCFLNDLTTTTKASGVVEQPSIAKQILQFLIAMFVMDTWQYFVHRYMHQNKFLYRHVHSWHHTLVVPYAIGTLYNHPIEGLLLDTIGGAISFLISGMTARTAVMFFCFTMVKAVDDHCGLRLPGNIFHLFFQNNTAYHDIHHQLQGLKYNYSQPFFSIWDKLLGTYMPFNLVKRPGGGFEARLAKE